MTPIHQSKKKLKTY